VWLTKGSMAKVGSFLRVESQWLTATTSALSLTTNHPNQICTIHFIWDR